MSELLPILVIVVFIGIWVAGALTFGRRVIRRLRNPEEFARLFSSALEATLRDAGIDPGGIEVRVDPGAQGTPIHQLQVEDLEKLPPEVRPYLKKALMRALLFGHPGGPGGRDSGYRGDRPTVAAPAPDASFRSSEHPTPVDTGRGAGLKIALLIAIGACLALAYVALRASA